MNFWVIVPQNYLVSCKFTRREENHRLKSQLGVILYFVLKRGLYRTLLNRQINQSNFKV